MFSGGPTFSMEANEQLREQRGAVGPSPVLDSMGWYGK
jgi:hypothetical protein